MRDDFTHWAWAVTSAGVLFAAGYGLAGPFVADMAAFETFTDLVESGRLRGLILNVVRLSVLPLGFHALRRHRGDQ